MPFASKMDGVRKFTSPDGRQIIEKWLDGRMTARKTECSLTNTAFYEYWHSSGIKIREALYVRNRAHGTHREWDETGETISISTWRHGVPDGRGYVLGHIYLMDGESHGDLGFRGWVTDRIMWETSYVDKTEGTNMKPGLSMSDGAWFRREAALLCRGGR